MKPFLSVLIPCRNEVRSLGRCRASIIANNYPLARMEVLVLDGASTDGTREVITDWAAAHPFIRRLENPAGSTPVALNLGVEAARGDVIARVDAHATLGIGYQSFLAEEEDLVGIFRDVGRRGAFVMQEDLRRFEENLARFLGAWRVLGVANATDGLLIALRAAGVEARSEVIFSSHTMVATASAIHFAGAIPVPVECGADHLIDPAVSRTGRAVVADGGWRTAGASADIAAEVTERCFHDLLAPVVRLHCPTRPRQPAAARSCPIIPEPSRLRRLLGPCWNGM
jgi:hypothetical protein